MNLKNLTISYLLIFSLFWLTILPNLARGYDKACYNDTTLSNILFYEIEEDSKEEKDHKKLGFTLIKWKGPFDFSLSWKLKVHFSRSHYLVNQYILYCSFLC